MLDKKKLFELDENLSDRENFKLMQYIDEHGPLTNKDIAEAYPEFYARYLEEEKNK